jgi:hypothetical protein
MLHTPEGQRCDARHVGVAVAGDVNGRNAARVARVSGKNLAPGDVGARIPSPSLEWSVRHRHRWAGKLLQAPMAARPFFS